MLTHDPSNALATVRAGFVLKGTSFREWCLQNNVDPGYAHKVVAGKTNGPRAIELKTRIIAASAKEAVCA